MIDTHCHLFLENFKEDLDPVLSRAAGNGLTHIFMPAIDLDSLSEMERIAHDKIRFHKMAGIHPTQVDGSRVNIEKKLAEYGSSDEIAAIGETGLDYYWSREYKDLQKKLLRVHCRIARAVGKPVILHNRESTNDLLDIIEEEQDGTLSGIWHCFNGTVSEGKRAIDLGLTLGIGGLVTFKNASVDQSVAQLPLDSMVVETDAPYLAPEPRRGERNEPAFVVHTARRLAELFDCPLQKIEEVTDRNALSVFRVKEN